MPLFRKKPPTHLPLETQLQTLAAHGIALRPDRSIDDLLDHWSREQYESDPYSLLLLMLGAEVEDESDGHFSDNVCSFDAECIEDTCDYRFTVERLAEIAGGDLPLQRVTDAVDIEARTAHIECQLDGRTHRFEPTVNNDWFDPAVIAWLGKLLAARASPRRYFLHDIGDQNFIIACITPAQAKALTKATGLRFLLLCTDHAHG